MDAVEQVRGMLRADQCAQFDMELAALLARWRGRAIAALEPRPDVVGPMRGFLLDDEDPPGAGVPDVLV